MYSQCEEQHMEITFCPRPFCGQQNNNEFISDEFNHQMNTFALPVRHQSQFSTSSCKFAMDFPSILKYFSFLNDFFFPTRLILFVNCYLWCRHLYPPKISVNLIEYLSFYTYFFFSDVSGSQNTQRNPKQLWKITLQPIMPEARHQALARDSFAQGQQTCSPDTTGMNIFHSDCFWEGHTSKVSSNTPEKKVTGMLHN